MAIQKKAPAAAPARAAARPGPAVKTNSHAATEAPQYASLNPEDFTSGGLLDDVDVTFESSRFVEWDYNGTIDRPVLALLVVMKYADPATGQEASADQYYSAGELSRFYPSEDGSHAVAVAGSKGLAGGTNSAILIKSVIDAGFPVDQFGDGDVSRMEGLVAHINRIAQPKRGGRITGQTQSGYEATVAVVTKIHQMPWEAAAPQSRPAPKAMAARAGAGAPASSKSGPAVPGRAAPGVGRPAPPRAGTPTTAAQEASDVTEEAAGILMAILENKGGTVAKMSIPPASFKLLAGNPNRSEILNLLADDEFLAVEDYGWQFDGKQVTSAA